MTLAPGKELGSSGVMPTGDRHGGTTPEHAFRSVPSLACPNLPALSADNLNSFATISGSRKKVFILFLRGTVRAGMLPSKCTLGSIWEGREPFPPAAPGDRVAALHRLADPNVKHGLAFASVALAPSRRFDRWRRLAADSSLPIPGRGPVVRLRSVGRRRSAAQSRPPHGLASAT